MHLDFFFARTSVFSRSTEESILHLRGFILHLLPSFRRSTRKESVLGEGGTVYSRVALLLKSYNQRLTVTIF